MSPARKRLLFWSPRLLGIAFAAFLASFALDVFGEGYGVRDTIRALSIHLIPAAIIVLALVLAWKFEWIGAILFPVLAVLSCVVSPARSHTASQNVAFVLAVPLLILRGLISGKLAEARRIARERLIRPLLLVAAPLYSRGHG